MNRQLQLWLLVGGNGAGKSTFHRVALEGLGLPFVNADRLVQLAYPEAPEANSYAAARLADRQREELLLQGISFCYETVYSHPAKIDAIARARALGYRILNDSEDERSARHPLPPCRPFGVRHWCATTSSQ